MHSQAGNSRNQMPELIYETNVFFKYGKVWESLGRTRSLIIVNFKKIFKENISLTEIQKKRSRLQELLASTVTLYLY